MKAFHAYKIAHAVKAGDSPEDICKRFSRQYSEAEVMAYIDSLKPKKRRGRPPKEVADDVSGLDM